MLTYILAAASLVLIGANLYLFLQVVARLKKHAEESLDTHMPYILRRLNAFLANCFIIAALQIALVFLG